MLHVPLAGSLGKTEKITNENWWKNNFFIDWIKSILKKREYMSDDENRNIKNKSEDDFEKNIVYLSVGALSLSLLLIEKIIPINDKTVGLYLLFIGWISLGSALLINLISHRISASQSIEAMLDAKNKEMDYRIKLIRWRERVSKMNCINSITIGLFGIGILLIITFVGINLHEKTSMKTDDKKNVIEGRVQEPPLNENIDSTKVFTDVEINKIREIVREEIKKVNTPEGKAISLIENLDSMKTKNK